MTDDRHAPGIDILVGFEVIHRPAETPGPCGDRTPLVGSRTDLAVAVEQRMDAVLEAVVVIGIYVAAVDGRQPVAVGDQHLDRPARSRRSPRKSLGGAFPRLRPKRRGRDERIVADRMVALEIQPEEHRNGIRAFVGHVQQEGHEVFFVVGEIDRDLLPGGHVAQGVTVFAQHFEMHSFGAPGCLSVDLRLEQGEEFGTAFGHPAFGVGDPPAVGHRQRIGQRVGRNPRFVVIHRRLLRPDARHAQTAQQQRVFVKESHDCNLRLRRVRASR